MQVNNWQTRKLSELCDINIGKTPSRSNLEYWNGNLKWVSISDMKGKFITQTKECITEKGAKESNSKLVPENTLLMSFKLSIGKLAFTTEPVYTNEAIASLKIKDDDVITNEYLYYVLQTIDLTAGSDKAVKGLTLNKAKLNELKIPYPSKEEQEKIVSILDKADEIRAKKKLANDKLDEFLKSTYIDLFAENTKKVKLEELCYFITKGTTPKAQDMSQDSGDIPYIKVYNLRFDTRLDFTINPTFVTKESHKNFLARSVVYPGDVLMNIVGPPLCKVSIVPDTYPEWNINQAIARFRCNKGLNNLYLAWFLTTPFAEKQMLRNAKKTSGQLNLTLEICKNIEIPLPSLDLQNKFAQIVEKVEAQKQKNELVIAQMNNLFNSLSQRAFKGGL